MKPLYYHRDGTPYEGDDNEATLAWGKDFNDMKLKRVAETILPDGKRISTVWLGLDHNYGDGSPLIFETMVFPKHSFGELDCERYFTEEQAKEGHERLVKKWSAEPHPPPF